MGIQLESSRCSWRHEQNGLSGRRLWRFATRLKSVPCKPDGGIDVRGAPSDNRFAPGERFAERYEIVRPLSSGGMGAVYEVLQLNLGRRRALKVLHSHSQANPDLRRRFMDEAKVIARVESDHVVEVIDSGIAEPTGSPYLVMELLDGEDLWALLDSEGSLEADTLVDFAWQASLAIEKLHDRQIVHRALKPSNLFVTTRDDGRRHITLIDFGIAKSLSAQPARATTGILGTPVYLSPEQIHGEVPTSFATDRYALAHVVYTLATGEPYFAQEKKEAGSEPYPLLMKIVEGPREAPVARAWRRRGVELPTGFDAWFETATATDPEQRFGSMGAMIVAPWLAGEMVDAWLETKHTEGLEQFADFLKCAVGEVDAISEAQCR